LNGFFVGAERGRFVELQDRDDLWALLANITRKTAAAHLRRARRKKRCPPAGHNGVHRGPEVEQIADPKQAWGFEQLVDEKCEHLLNRLGDARLREIAVRKLEGYTTAEIAAMLGRTVRSIERKTKLIRAIWSQEGSP